MPVPDPIDTWIAIKTISGAARDEAAAVTSVFNSMYDEACDMLDKFAGGTPQDQQALTKTVLEGSMNQVTASLESKKADIVNHWNQSLAAGHINQT